MTSAAGPSRAGRPAVARIVAQWAATPRSLAHIRDGENVVYSFDAGSSRLFLRLTRDLHRSRAQLEAELDFVCFVASCGVAAALPVPSEHGALIETLQAENGAVWHAVTFLAAPGRHFRYFTSDIGRPLFHAWGTAMGALHSASRRFEPRKGRRRPVWREQDTTSCDLDRVPAGETEALREHARVGEWLASLPIGSESWGLIHGDFERTNVLLDGETLRVFDFDDACYHWYVADVANALWAFRAAPPDDRHRFLAWFLEGYGERCGVDGDVREQMSWFIRLRSLSLFINRRHQAQARGAMTDHQNRLRIEFQAPSRW